MTAQVFFRLQKQQQSVPSNHTSSCLPHTCLIYYLVLVTIAILTCDEALFAKCRSTATLVFELPFRHWTSFNRHQSPTIQAHMSIRHLIGSYRISWVTDREYRIDPNPNSPWIFWPHLELYGHVTGIIEVDICLAALSRLFYPTPSILNESTLIRFSLKLFLVQISTYNYLRQDRNW